MLIAFDPDALHINPCGRNVSVPERILRLGDAARLLGYHPRVSVARLVQVYRADAGL